MHANPALMWTTVGSSAETYVSDAMGRLLLSAHSGKSSKRQVICSVRACSEGLKRHCFSASKTYSSKTGCA